MRLFLKGDERAPRRVVQAEGVLYFAGERDCIMGPQRYGSVTFVYRFGYPAVFASKSQEIFLRDHPVWQWRDTSFGFATLRCYLLREVE